MTRRVNNEIPSIGNLVQVASTPLTLEQGLAASLGEVVQVGSPSSVDLSDVLGGECAEEAILVELQGLRRRLWFGASVLQTVGVRAEDDAFAKESSRVRVRATPLTMSLGYADLIGDIRGDTRPSVSGVGPVIGLEDSDFAVNVWLEALEEQVWFAPDLLEPVKKVGTTLLG